jgi:hypothetical protein
LTPAPCGVADNRPIGEAARRAVAATARERDFRIVTRDRRLLAYAESGYCRTLAC